jgi:hypothetical protein
MDRRTPFRSATAVGLRIVPTMLRREYVFSEASTRAEDEQGRLRC